MYVEFFYALEIFMLIADLPRGKTIVFVKAGTCTSSGTNRVRLV